MKKTLIIALGGMMLFAFTQCGGGGTKEFNDAKKVMNELTKAVKNAKTCDELHDAWNNEEILVEKEYSEGEKMTAEEKAEIEKIGKEFFSLCEQRSNELCK